MQGTFNMEGMSRPLHGLSDEVLDDVVNPEDCFHPGPTYVTRFGDTVCEECHTTLSWHPNDVRPDIYGEGTAKWIATMAERYGVEDEHQRLPDGRIMERYIDWEGGNT